MPARVVLVTGASRGGLGYAMCQEFAHQGCRVYAGVRRIDSAEGLKPLGVTLVQLEVTDATSRQHVIDLVLKTEGRLDVLVNNAGISYTGPLADLQPGKLQQLFDTNLFAPIFLAQLVIPGMAKQGSGTIVNISSISAYTWVPMTIPYTATKAALTAVSKSLRLEVEPLGIKVMDVVLGVVKTNVLQKRVVKPHDWPATSLYASAADVVAKAFALSDKDQTSSEEAARSIVAAALRPSPPASLWTAKGSSVIWLTTFFPTWVVDWMLKQMLGACVGYQACKFTVEGYGVSGWWCRPAVRKQLATYCGPRCVPPRLLPSGQPRGGVLYG